MSTTLNPGGPAAALPIVITSCDLCGAAGRVGPVRVESVVDGDVKAEVLNLCDECEEGLDREKCYGR